MTKSLFDIYRNSPSEKLHILFSNELTDTIEWISRNFSTSKGRLSYYDTALAIGLDFGDDVVVRRDIIKGLQKELGINNPPDILVEICIEKATETMELPNPEQLVRYFERSGKLRSRKIKDVANFIVLQDISTAIEDDNQELVRCLEEMSRKSRVGESIERDIVYLAEYFDVDKRVIKKYTKRFNNANK